MSDDYKPIRELNAITYLRNFIIESLIKNITAKRI